jgi:hypothetical protein
MPIQNLATNAIAFGRGFFFSTMLLFSGHFGTWPHATAVLERFNADYA